MFRKTETTRRDVLHTAAAEEWKFSRSGGLLALFDDRVLGSRVRVNGKVLKDRVAVLALLKMPVLFKGQFAFSVYE